MTFAFSCDSLRLQTILRKHHLSLSLQHQAPNCTEHDLFDKMPHPTQITKGVCSQLESATGRVKDGKNKMLIQFTKSIKLSVTLTVSIEEEN